jgi:hypothetical protein
MTPCSKLLTHLYQFFGTLLGCSTQGMPGFAPYNGDPSMFQVHRFMRLDPFQLGFFIQQVALAGASFGVADADLEAVGMALQQLFGLRCAPPVEVVKAQGPQLQAICIVESCPLAPEAVCSKYDAPDGTSGGNGEAGESGSPTATPSGVSTAGAAATGVNIAAAAAMGVVALLL